MKANEQNLVVYFLTPRYAEEHTRRVYNIPPHVGMGWTPYTILVLSNGGTLAHSAYHSARDFRRRFPRESFAVELGAWRFRGFRGGKIKERVTA